MNLKLITQIVLLSCLAISSFSQFTTGSSQINAYNNNNVLKSYSIKTLDQESSNTQQYSQYGGALNLPTDLGSGFFKAAQINNIWWIIDPLGYQFYSVGINSVKSLSLGNIQLPDDLKSLGVNTYGSWSDQKLKSLAYTPQLNLLNNFKNSNTYYKLLYSQGIIPVFDKNFLTSCKTNVQATLQNNLNDKYLLGYFTDNELPLYSDNLLDLFLGIDKTNDNFIVVDSWMRSRSGLNYLITDTDRQDFLEYLTDTYYKTVRDCIRAYDTNHMIIGSRLHGSAKAKYQIFKSAGKYMDIVSVNVYSWFQLDNSKTANWVESANKPFLISEFYTKDITYCCQNFQQSGEGWYVPSQDEKAKWFENFVLQGLSNPGFVGFHHFKYSDEATNNCGIVDLNGKFWPKITSSIAKIGTNIYPLRNQLVQATPLQ